MANAAMADLGKVTDGCVAHTRFTVMSSARFRRMRSREQWPDFEACRDDEGERAGEGGDLDGTTLRRAVMSQYVFLSRFVALAVGQPAMPIAKRSRHDLDLTSAWQCRMIPLQSRERGFSSVTVTALGPPQLLAVGIALCGPLRYTNRGL